jgi:hypothetical protein
VRLGGLLNTKWKSKRSHLIRRIIRHSLGIAFWVHAIFALGLLRLPPISIQNLSRHVFNAILVVFIVNYSLFTENGWWSVSFDLLFIYFLPFIYLARIVWWSGGLFYKSIKSGIVWQSPQFVYDRPIPQTNPQKEEGKKPEVEDSKVTGVTRRLTRVFFKFALLWSLLILTVNWKPFIVIAIGVTFLGAAKAIWILWDIFSGGTGWVDKMENNFSIQIKALIEQISQWDGSTSPENLKQTINSLKFHRSLYNFITDNTAILKRWAFTLSLIVSVPFYCYVSFLFSCVYFGIGKISNFDFSFANAFVDSLFMPFAWSALPSNLPIRFIGGLQATYIAVIGYNILFRHLGSRLDKITAVACKLGNPFQEELLKARMQKVEEALSKHVAQPLAPSQGNKALPAPRKSRRR